MTLDYIVNYIALAEVRRTELNITQAEMPGLMACPSEFGDCQPLEGARIV